MADEIFSKNVQSSSSSVNDKNDTKVCAYKRSLSMSDSEDEYEVNDPTVPSLKINKNKKKIFCQNTPVERDLNNLSNQEIALILESCYNFDDETKFEDKTSFQSNTSEDHIIDASQVQNVFSGNEKVGETILIYNRRTENVLTKSDKIVQTPTEMFFFGSESCPDIFDKVTSEPCSFEEYVIDNCVSNKLPIHSDEPHINFESEHLKNEKLLSIKKVNKIDFVQLDLEEESYKSKSNSENTTCSYSVDFESFSIKSKKQPQRSILVDINNRDKTNDVKFYLDRDHKYRISMEEDMLNSCDNIEDLIVLDEHNYSFSEVCLHQNSNEVVVLDDEVHALMGKTNVYNITSDKTVDADGCVSMTKLDCKNSVNNEIIIDGEENGSSTKIFPIQVLEKSVSMSINYQETVYELINKNYVTELDSEDLCPPKTHFINVGKSSLCQANDFIKPNKSVASEDKVYESDFFEDLTFCKSSNNIDGCDIDLGIEDTNKSKTNSKTLESNYLKEPTFCESSYDTVGFNIELKIDDTNKSKINDETLESGFVDEFIFSKSSNDVAGCDIKMNIEDTHKPKMNDKTLESDYFEEPTFCKISNDQVGCDIDLNIANTNTSKTINKTLESDYFEQPTFCKSSNNIVGFNIELSIEDNNKSKSINKTLERNDNSFSSTTPKCNLDNEGLSSIQNNLSTFSDDKNNMTTDIYKNLSLDSPDVERNLHCYSSDDSLLFMPSKKDLLKYLHNSLDSDENNEENKPEEICVSQILDNSIHDENFLPQRKSPYYITSVSNIETANIVVPDPKGSYVVKDYEDNVKYFYDCDLSSIENSDSEDNHMSLSLRKDCSLDNSILDSEKLELAISACYSDHQAWQDKLKTTHNLESECPKVLTVAENQSSFVHTSYDHKYTKSLPEEQTWLDKSSIHNTVNCIQPLTNGPSTLSNGLNSDKNKLECSKNSNMNTEHSCVISRYNCKNKIASINIDLTKEDDLNECNKEMFDSGEDSLDKDKTISLCCGSFSNKGKKRKSLSGRYSSRKKSRSNNQEFNKHKTSSGLSVHQNETNSENMDKKCCLDENNKGLDENDNGPINPFIFKSVAKSTGVKSFRKALTKKAAANININDMGDQALATYLTQQTMTLNVLEVLHKSLDTCPLPEVTTEDPKGLVVPLLPHQKHAIAWLMWRESQKPCGGILADDMGLGKTLSMISLVLKSAEENKDNLSVEINNHRNNFINGGTLVVCPASVLHQWENEINSKVTPGLLKIGQYYGVNRNISAKELATYDIVTTSYHIIMWDYKKHLNFEKHEDFRSPLYKIKWKRIILDEAHIIRNPKTQTSLAVCEISSTNRWAITGTPVHNKEADFYTLLKFVGCAPFDDWPVWKRWVGNSDEAGKSRLSLIVKTLMLRRTKKELFEFTSFKLPPKDFHVIEIELTSEERNAYEQLIQFSSNIFANYLFEKATKENVFNSSVEVQCKVEYFHAQSQKQEEVFQDHPELQKLFKQFKNIKDIQTYHILVLLLRLRQICNHPCLINGRIIGDIVKEENVDIKIEDLGDIEKDIKENYKDISKTCCEADKVLCDLNTATSAALDCNEIDYLTVLMSRVTLNETLADTKTTTPMKDDMIFKKTWLSSKIKAVCDMVWEKVLKNNGQDKAIVVSQWPSMLYLLRHNLSKYNVKMEMFSGAVPILERNKIVRDFNNSDGGPQILLLSLSAGGVGLNLMAANHMFIVDIHWNPQLEAQACDRIYRLGQLKPVNVYKFICTNTIETQILMIQAKKLKIAEGVFKGTSVTSSKITLDDLKEIFQMK